MPETTDPLPEKHNWKSTNKVTGIFATERLKEIQGASAFGCSKESGEGRKFLRIKQKTVATSDAMFGRLYL